MPIAQIVSGLVGPFKKEILIGGAILALSTVIFFMDMRIENLELKVENSRLAMQTEERAHNQCKQGLLKQKSAVDTLKEEADVREGILAASLAEAVALETEHKKEIKNLMDAPVIKSCEDGMNTLWENLQK